MDEELRKLNAQKVIRFEDIMNAEGGNEMEEEEENKFHELFMKEVKKKELEEKMRLREDEDEQEDIDMEQ